MQKIQISHFKDIDKILDIIHDQYFEKDNIHFDSESSTLEIKFERENRNEKILVSKKLFVIEKWRVPVIECILKINYVEECQIEGKEVFGLFNEIEYDEERKLMVITSDPSITIKLKVKEFQIEIENMGKLIKEKTYLSFLFFEIS